jgi:outer membrane lipoprotein-sorting protein
MQRLTLFSLFLAATLSCIAQSDPQAVAVLEKFSSTATTAPSVTIKFDIVTTDQVEKTADTIPGSVVISKENYMLELPDNIIWYNGKTSWSLLTAEKEVTISEPDKKSTSFESKPSSIFTMHKTGYKRKLVEERNDGYVIDLYPEDIKNEMLRVRLFILKPAYSLKTLEYKRRDGVTIFVNIKNYNLKQVPSPTFFTFDQSKYAGYDIIDIR